MKHICKESLCFIIKKGNIYLHQRAWLLGVGRFCLPLPHLFSSNSFLCSISLFFSLYTHCSFPHDCNHREYNLSSIFYGWWRIGMSTLKKKHKWQTYSRVLQLAAHSGCFCATKEQIVNGEIKGNSANLALYMIIREMMKRGTSQSKSLLLWNVHMC